MPDQAVPQWQPRPAQLAMSVAAAAPVDLAALEHLPVAGHAAVYAAVLERLQDALAGLDEV